VDKLNEGSSASVWSGNGRAFFVQQREISVPGKPVNTGINPMGIIEPKNRAIKTGHLITR
jgi:hypothetical protein